jgi:hypothetical protein
MATPVVPNQFAVGKNKIVHKPTKATFGFDTGHTTFKSVNWVMRHIPDPLRGKLIQRPVGGPLRGQTGKHVLILSLTAFNLSGHSEAFTRLAYR